MDPSLASAHFAPQHSLSVVQRSPAGRQRLAMTPSQMLLKQRLLQQSMLSAQAPSAGVHIGPAAQMRGPPTVLGGGQANEQQLPAKLHDSPIARHPVVGVGGVSLGLPASPSPSTFTSPSPPTLTSPSPPTIASPSPPTLTSPPAPSPASSLPSLPSPLASPAASRGVSTLIDSLPQAAISAARRTNGGKPQMRNIGVGFTSS